MRSRKTLYEALEIAIGKISDCFKDNWLLTGSGRSGGAGCVAGEDVAAERHWRLFKNESHFFTEIFICLEGNCAIELEGRIYEIDEGDVCLILPGEAHCEIPRKDCGYEAIWMSVDLNTFAMHLSGKSVTNGRFYTADGYTSKSSYEFFLLLNGLKGELERKLSHYEEIVKATLLQMLATTVRMLEMQNGVKQNDNLWKDSVVMQVQSLVEKNYMKSIRLSDISHEVCISINHLNGIFKSMTGRTIMQYVEDFRMEKAKQLLRSTGLRASEVAMQLGYCDPYHFSKAFKKETGFTPTQFRRLKSL